MEAEKHSTLVESINGIATIKALSTEKSTYERAEGQIIETIYRGISLGKMSNAQRTLQNFVSQCGTLAIYWIGSLYIFDGSMSLGQLISFVTLSGYFLGPFARLLMLQPALQESFVASDRLSEILDMPEENENTENLVKLDSIDSFKGNIKVENLSFSYGTRGKTLDGISFDIKGGQKVAFVGLSGSGKTTMTKLLLKFYDYSEGEIFIDGMSLKDIDTLSLRKITGYVPQEVLLFSGTILENIALGTEEACEDFADKILTHQAEFNDYPEMAAVIDEYLDLFEKGYVNEDYMTVSYDEILGRLASGEIAMIYGATEILTSIEESYPDANFTIFNPPVGYDDKDVLAYLPTAMGIAVNKDTENLDVIKEVFELWSTPEYGDIYFESRPGFPNIEGVDGNQDAMNPDVLTTYNEYMDNGRVVAQMNQYIDTLQPLFGNTLWVYFLEAPSKGNMDGKAVLDRFQKDVDEFMTEKGVEGWN